MADAARLSDLRAARIGPAEREAGLTVLIIGPPCHAHFLHIAAEIMQKASGDQDDCMTLDFLHGLMREVAFGRAVPQLFK
jgi:hypothetical protein